MKKTACTKNGRPAYRPWPYEEILLEGYSSVDDNRTRYNE